MFNITKKQRELKKWVEAHPDKVEGNVQLMRGNVRFDMEKELARLRRSTKKCKSTYKV